MLGDFSWLTYLCHVLNKGCLNAVQAALAEIIPIEPGQVMLPRNLA